LWRATVAETLPAIRRQFEGPKVDSVEKRSDKTYTGQEFGRDAAKVVTFLFKLFAEVPLYFAYVAYLWTVCHLENIGDKRGFDFCFNSASKD
jgi:hypothetical protein